MGRRYAGGVLPGWVVIAVVATYLGGWYLCEPFLRHMSCVIQGVVSFLGVGFLGIAARYLVLSHPVVFFQDILAELALYAFAGSACGLAASFQAVRWGIRVSPVWSALGVYLALTLLFDSRGRRTG